MLLIKNLLISIFIFTAIVGKAQNGFIRGTIIDNNTGKYLIGVVVKVEGTQNGAISDLDGKFSISISPGKYALSFSYVSFESLSIKDIVVEKGKATIINDIRLKEKSIELDVVVIRSSQLKNTENALLILKRRAANLVDGISADNFKKIGDADVASAINRVAGISVAGGKYVFVRGLGDRYTKTILNGMDIPGLDPDRNTLQIDIFPTGIIDNILVHKSFVADLPADFTGGVIDINTKDFPDSKKGEVSFSGGYNPSFHFNKNYLNYKGGKTDFLGFDDGTRNIPATTNIPFFSEAIADPNGPIGSRYKEILKAFNPTLKASEQTSFMDFSLGANFGNQVSIKKVTLGYNFLLTYKNTTEFYTAAQYSRYGLSGNPDITEMEVRELQTGNFGINNVLLSAMAGFAVKTQKSKYRINILHLQSGESKAGIFNYYNADQGAVFEGFQHNLEYSQRALSNLLLSGKHILQPSSWNIEWKLAATLSNIIDPDIRFTRYENRNGNLVIGTEAGFPQRIWRELEEINTNGIIHITKDYKFLKRVAKLKFGGGYTYKERDFILRNFNLNIRNITLTGNPDELFFPENLWPYQNNLNRGTTYDAVFLPTNPNAYNARVNNTAGYISTELELTSRLKSIIGIRFENYVQRYSGQDQLGLNVLNDDIVLDDLGFFPTLNMIFAVTPKQNLRFSYTKTIARPSIKELSYAEIYDPLTGRTFIGGLFRDANDIAGVEYWDGNLVSTDIQNIDLRWEAFQTEGRMISVSVFYKYLSNPIEIVQFATEANSFQPRNVGDGQLIGTELEIRQNLKALGNFTKNINLSFNFTYTNSRIQLSKTEFESRKENARTGQIIEPYRVMAGQVPYIINGGIFYKGSGDGFWSDLEAGFFYNVQGQTLQYVGIVDRPDIYTVPFNSLNFNANKNFGEKKRLSIGFKIENILNSSLASVYKSYDASDQYFSKLSPGMNFQVRLNYKFY
ncbi:MAG: TonB-dependent receptor [Sediminibacterium sp.]|nr:TonB-dependent receptor [Sediminibacterium sp.]